MKRLLVFLFLLAQLSVAGQYILNGSAQRVSCNCYTLTPPTPTQSGSVWNGTKINLATSFDFWFNVFLGCNDAGADGIVFILQPISTSVGSTGEGMGFGGVTPSVGIALDTYHNANQNDPTFDHISIQRDGNVNHSGDLAGPVAASATSNDIEDCQWHRLRITWDAGTHWLRAYFDGVLRVETQINLVSSVFNNNPEVYWGFTGATGGAVNLQQFCTALNPIFASASGADTACVNTPVPFANNSESFAPIASYLWTFGDGTTSTAQNPPPHTYALPGRYPVALKITGLDGCEEDTTRFITVLPPPSANLQVFDTCAGKPLRWAFSDNNVAVRYNWTLNGQPNSTGNTPALPLLPVGGHNLQLKVESVYQCGTPAVASADFLVKPKPQIEAAVEDGCVNERLQFSGVQNDNLTTGLQWTWRINNAVLRGREVQQQFAAAGDVSVELWAVAGNGCSSDTVRESVRVAQAFLQVRDTVLLRNQPGRLNAIGNGAVVWQPALGLSDPFSLTPIATLNRDQQYTVQLTTPEGCQTSKQITVKVFDGPTVYVASAFTPNGDRRNDVLLPVYVGMRQLKRFSVYNRWGQPIFRTTSFDKGWNGANATGTFVWVVEAITEAGKAMTYKGTVTVLR